MKLDNVLEIKAKEYYDKSESIIKNKKNSQLKYEELKSKLNHCKNLLNVLNGNDGSMSLDVVCNILIEYGHGDIKNNLNNIIVTLNAIKSGLPVSLTREQEIELKKYISSLESLIKQIEDKMSEYKSTISSGSEEYDLLTEKYLLIECLIEKIRDPENTDILDENDFQIVYDIINSSEDLSYDTKSQMLIQFRKYNSDRASLKPKDALVTSYEEILEFFKENGLSDNFIKNSAKFKNEIERNINLASTQEVIDYLKSVNIKSGAKSYTLFETFENPTLLTLLVYGDKDTIMKKYEEFCKNGTLCQLFFKTASVWMNTLNKNNVRRNPGKNKPSNLPHSPGTLKYDSQRISVDDILENEKFLQSIGFKVSRHDDRYTRLLISNPLMIKKNYEIYKKYGFFDVDKKLYPSMMQANRLLEKCDLCVELGILNGVGASDKECNLIKYSPSKLGSYPNMFFIYLAKLKANARPHEYYGLIASDKGAFATTTIKQQMAINGLGIDDKKENEFIEENFEDVNKEIPNCEQYDDLYNKDESLDYDEEVLSLPLLDKLEKENKKNNFVYKFNDQFISRLKVLRISSALYKEYKDINEEMLFYALTKGSYLSKEAIESIKKEISYSYKGGMSHGLS